MKGKLNFTRWCALLEWWYLRAKRVVCFGGGSCAKPARGNCCWSVTFYNSITRHGLRRRRWGFCRKTDPQSWYLIHLHLLPFFLPGPLHPVQVDRPTSTHIENKMKMSKLSNQTNSQDPQAVNSRVFVGNLNTFQCSKTDVERMFQRYGRLAGKNVAEQLLYF